MMGYSINSMGGTCIKMYVSNLPNTSDTESLSEQLICIQTAGVSDIAKCG